MLLITRPQKIDSSSSYLLTKTHLNELSVEVYWGEDKIALGQICSFENAVNNLKH